MKRLASVIVLLTTVFTLAFPAGQQDSSISSVGGRERITVRYLSFPMWNKTSSPFSDALLVQKLSEMTNIDFVWEQMDSSSQLIEKQNIIIASGDFPDIMQLILGPDLREAGKAGLVIDFSKYLNKLPNFVEYLLRDTDYAQYIQPDGAIYQLREMNFDKQPMGMMAYRKDLFEKHDLKVDTWENLYQSLKTLKRIYPDSTPVCNITTYGYTNLSWSFFGVQPGFYKDPYTNVLKYGPVDEYDRFKYVISWYKRLWEDNLLHPDFFSMSTEATQEAWVAGKTFWSSDQPDPFAWETGRLTESQVPGAVVRPMPFVAIDGEDAGRYGHLDAGSSVAWWYSVAISGRSRHIDRLVDFVNLGYSDEIRISNYHGIRGTSWDFNNEGRVYMIPPYAEVSNEVADLIGPFMSRALVSAKEKVSTNPLENERWAFFNHYEPYYQKYSRGIPVNFPDDVKEDIGLLVTDLNTYTSENIVKFIIGERSMTEWDTFIEELKKLGVDEIRKAYTEYAIDRIAVYNKVVGNIGK